MILEVDAMKLIEEKIGFKVNRITQLGNGYDSTAFLVNDGYIFKIKHSANEKKGYKKENAIYEFLRYNLKSDIKVPLVEYLYISEDVSIMGYKYIEGKILSPEVYKTLSDDQKEQLKQDIAKFLKQLHNLDYSEIKQYVIDNKQNVLEEYQLLKDTIYDQLSDKEKEYVEAFMKRLNTTTVFDDKKCLCHNDFSCNHLLLDENNRLCGIIDFGDSGIIDEYADFVYLLEDSDEELGHEFGEDVLKLYGNIDIEKTTEYQKLVDDYYPIETIIYGIKNNQKEFIEKGRRLIKARK